MRCLKTIACLTVMLGTLLPSAATLAQPTPCEFAKLLAADAAAEDRFARAVAVSGDTAVIGAYYDDDRGTNSGAAYVFRYDGASWVQEQKLLASDGVAEDYFGLAVSISDGPVPRIVVGTANYRDEVNQDFDSMWSDSVVLACTPEFQEDPEPYLGVLLAEQFAEVDGLPMIGVAGTWESGPWRNHIFYSGWYAPWITMNTAGYLLLDVVK